MPFGFSLLVNFYCPLDGIKNILFEFVCLDGIKNIFLLSFLEHVGQKCLLCRCVSKVRGCPSSFWDLVLVFCP
jgi:hypothetical protein